jgi:hypothetical protein
MGIISRCGMPLGIKGGQPKWVESKEEHTSFNRLSFAAMGRAVRAS